ncbi:DEAD/DEAH box helicase family protein [Fictibacillus sp. WQ 8-8]|uniref:DEAD/DEAH box helicase family protein n=1 Tax=Fictibacillus sp. WQ 8-8 TaxID=2938788 RepID=UPI00210C5A8B|nr:DEAD/DEAH box helicase family protein [Fictibacillus sp. WQ 8-8]MCQ6267136.1 DEAD/DEAH box helicase family protein [Fictibacillus sp. WQ 8-8]
MKSHNEMYWQSMKLANGFKARYVSELVTYSKIIDGIINLIESPCGTGKTTFFIDEVVKKAKNKERILYLVDTSVLEESLLSKYDEYLKPYDSSVRATMSFNEDQLLGHGFGIQLNEDLKKDNRAICMTYQKFAHILNKSNDTSFLNNIKFLCCDEVHNLAKYIGYDLQLGAKKEETVLFKALEKIVMATDKGTFKTLFMTATPYRIIRLLKESFNYTCNKIVSENELRGYLFNSQKVYTNINNILKELRKSDLSEDNKILMYVETIKKAEEVREKLERDGFNVACLWSINNEKKMDNLSRKVREHIVEFEEIPDYVDVVIINAAYETGYNIFDKENNAQTVVVHSRNSEVITQVRGRIRHDIENLVTLNQSGSIETIKRDGSVVELCPTKIEKYIGIPLTKEKKDEFVQELNLINGHGRGLKWTSISKMLVENGFKVEPGKTRIDGRQIKFHIIEQND